MSRMYSLRRTPAQQQAHSVSSRVLSQVTPLTPGSGLHLPSAVDRVLVVAAGLIPMAALLVAFALIPGQARAQTATGGSETSASAPVGNLPAANLAARDARRRLASRVWRSDGSAAATEVEADARAWSTDAAVIAQGRKLYTEGLRRDGKPLVAKRLDGQVRITGAAAACVLCHRRSGLGAVEGANQIAPISGRYLFDQDSRAIVNRSFRARKSFNQRHDPYSLETLARALRDGHGVDGREFEALMPRYEVSDDDVLALASYLRTLSNTWSTGVDERMLHVATVITPDVDPRRKAVFLETIQGVVDQKNGNFINGQRGMSSGAEMALRTERRWDLQVWELQGPASTWQAQLQRLYANHPVFALASGLGAGNWDPVHQFCEARALPCWFPSVGAVPADSETDFYSVYFTRGVALEAEVLGQRLTNAATGKSAAATSGGQLLQVWADRSVAQLAVATLRERAVLAGLKARDVDLSPGGGNGSVDPKRAAALSRELERLGAADTVVIWLSPLQLQAVAKQPKTKAQLYLSASLGGGDRIDTPQAWQDQARAIYPYQLPELRQRGLTFFKEWLRIRKLPLSDEILQSEVYFAMSYLNDTLVDMLDNVHRDYLLERGENMLSLREAAKAEDEARELSLHKAHLISKDTKPTRELGARPIAPRRDPRAKPASQTMAAMASADNVSPQTLAAGAQFDTSPVPLATDVGAVPITTHGPGVSASSGAPESTNVYPHLSLGQFQRHASKGAYIVRMNADGVKAESEWLIP